VARPATLRVHLLEDGRIILKVSSRATMAVTLHGCSMTVGDGGELAELLQQARTA
jgi:hypothetical protein